LTKEVLFGTDKKHIVVDCDEVLVNISPMILALIHDKKSGNFDYYNKYFRLAEDFDIDLHEERILSRPVFRVDEWLVRPDIYDNFEESEVQEMLEKLNNEVIFHPNLYDMLKPTQIANSIAQMTRTSMVDKVSVVTRTSDNNLESKERFLKKLFKGSMKKVDIYYVEPDEKKSDVVSMLGEDIAIIYEDEIKNIEDIVYTCDNVKDLQIMIPSFGYNVNIERELYDECERKGIKLQPYYYK